MSRTITVDVFDLTSIQRAVRDIEDYRRWVQDRTNELRRRVAELIAERAQEIFNGAVAADLIDESAVIGGVTVTVQENGNVSTVIATGQDAIFMEFGAGVYNNGPVGSEPNPLSTENGLGFSIGSYSTYRPDKEIWAYRGSDGVRHVTHGTPASMPLYRSIMSVIDEIDRIAREVFST